MTECYRCHAWPCCCADGITLIHGDCRDVLPQLEPGSVDLVLTDPPYPSYHVELFQYDPKSLEVVASLPCRQLIFWTPSTPFPFEYQGLCVWEKCVGSHTQFELIYERNAASGYQIYRYMTPHSSVRARIVGDVCFDHPSQKPLQLIRRLLEKPAATVLDPFAGSGTTGRACKDLGRKCLMIEIEEKYVQIAAERLRQEVLF